MRETRRVAEREWPPREKKSESRETESRPRTWEKSRERSSSVGPRGGEKDSARGKESGRGSAARALRSTLPEEERGRESRTRRSEGTMASGREEERDERRARKSWKGESRTRKARRESRVAGRGMAAAWRTP